MMKEELSPFNIFLGIERFSKHIYLFVDSDGDLGNVSESHCYLLCKNNQTRS